MSLWIKICGNTLLEDARLAAEAGADAVGFVFAPSPRQVTVEQVAQIVQQLPKSVEKIGVFVDSSPEQIVDAIRACGLTGVQFHHQGESAIPAQLHTGFGPDFRVLRVAHFGPGAAAQVALHAGNPQVDGVLVDSRTADAVGGTGIAYDWDEAARTLFGNGRVKLIAAGGLNPANVAAAIAKLRPWGVDVASGVETAPGRKDPAKIRAFIANARAAGNHL